MSDKDVYSTKYGLFNGYRRIMGPKFIVRHTTTLVVKVMYM